MLKIFIITTLIITANAFSAVYLVGAGRPYISLQQVSGLLNPGDTVKVDGNQTYPGDVSFTRAGTEQSKIVIKGIRINNQRPIISGGANTVHFKTLDPWDAASQGGHHYIFEGFEVTGGSVRGIYHNAKDLTIRDCYIHHNPAHGILGADAGSGSLLLEYTEIAFNGSGDSRHQIYMATDQERNPGSVFRMQHCYIHDGVGGNNVKSRSERNEIYYNWIEGAFYHELELIGSQEAPEALKREDSDVVGNVFYKKLTAYNSAHPGWSVTRFGGDGTAMTNGRYRFVNNTVISGESAVFRLYDGIESVEIYNNAFYNPTGVVKLVRTVEAAWVSIEKIRGTNNWIEQGAVDISAGITGSIFSTDPGFSDLATNDLRPVVTSSLINKGIPSIPFNSGYEIANPLITAQKLPPLGKIETVYGALNRPVNGVIDIGAYEYFATSSAASKCVDINSNSTIQNGSAQYPYKTIQSAIDVANNNDTIKVAVGSYSNIDSKGKSLIVLGGYSSGNFSIRTQNPALTTISGGAQNIGVKITRFTDLAFKFVLDNFTVKNSLKGIVCDTEVSWPQAKNVTISNNIIENNGAVGVTTRGAGILIVGANDKIINNIIRNNRGGRGAGIARNGNPDSLLVENNLIENNYTYDDHAGGIYLDGKDVVIKNNRITGNKVVNGYGWGGGILILGTAHLSGNVYSDNYAPSCGGAFFADEGAVVYLDNELFYHNQGGSDGGASILVDDGEPGQSFVYINNCTFADNYNTGNYGGNAIQIQNNSHAVVKNSIFWNNGDDFYARTGSTIATTYSICQDNLSGAGILHQDPLFVNSTVFDYRLKSKAGHYTTIGWIIDTQHSPGIDSGDPATAYNLEPAPNGSRVNLGFDGNTVHASKSTNSSTICESEKELNLLNCYPNPFNPSTTISYTIGNSGLVKLSVYNAKGELVKELVNTMQPVGKYSVDFNSTAFNSGVYFYKLQTKDKSIINKMIMLK